MSGHVDAESLALCAEGELSRGRTARVRAHLAGCAECAPTAAALAGVTTRLSQVPVPPMPAAVAARLDAALSAESAHRAAAPARRASRCAPHRGRRGAARCGPRAAAHPGRDRRDPGGGGRGRLRGEPVLRVRSSSAVRSSSGRRSPGPGAGASLRRGRAQRVVAWLAGDSPAHESRPAAPGYVRTGTDYRRGTLAAQAKSSWPSTP